MLICAILFHNFKTEVRYQFEGFVLSIFCGDEGGGGGVSSSLEKEVIRSNLECYHK